MANSGLDKQKSINQLKYEAKGHTLYPLKMRKTVENDNRKAMIFIQLTIAEFWARRPFKLELSARDPGLRVTLVRVTAYDQFGLYRWWTAHSEVTSAQVLITTTILWCFHQHCWSSNVTVKQSSNIKFRELAFASCDCKS